MTLKNNKIYLLFELINQGFRKYRWQILFLTFLGFLSGFLEGIGINAVVPLLSFIINNGQEDSDIISKAIHILFNNFSLNYSLKYLLIFICLLFILRAVTLIFFNYIKVKISATYEEATRTELLDETLKADWSFLLRQKLGHLETILATNVYYSGLLLQYISATIMNLTGLVIYICIAISISKFITLMSLGVSLLFFILFSPIIFKIKKISHERNQINKSISHFINENITGMKTIKSMLVGEHISFLGKKYFKRIKELLIKVNFLKIISEVSAQPVGLIFVCILFAVSYKTSNFNFASFAVTIYLIQRIFIYIQQLQANLQAVAETSPYLKNILDYKQKVKDNYEINIGLKKNKFEKSLEFKNIFFSYNKQKNILAGVNFFVERGEMLGLIGNSGSGKTTIADLVLRLFAPDRGEILLDGVNIKDVDIRDWRENIGYISQDIFLTNDTITNNIRFYNENISDEEIEEAAKMAYIYDFIKSRPEGFNTIVGERGLLLSVGQRQRLIIARILARKPKLLILDEATSALDNESEKKIQEIIEGLKNKMTVLIIAHRLSTIINADRVLVLDKGAIIEGGKPQELLKDKNSYFSKMYNIKN